MQFHGSLNRAGTTMRVDAALLVGEAGQRPHSLYLARRDTASVTEVTILEVVAAIAGGDTRLRLSSGDVFHLPAGADKSALRSFYPRGRSAVPACLALNLSNGVVPWCWRCSFLA